MIAMQKKINLQSAMEDVSVIKQTLEKSKVHFEKLSTLFVIFGTIQLCTYIFQQFGKLYFLKNKAFLGAELLFYTKYITLVVLFFFFMRMRNSIKKSNNIYTLQLFDIWGVILFFVPMIRFSTMFFQTILYDTSMIVNVAVFAYAAIDLIEYVSVLIGVLVTGCILNKWELKITALLLLFTCPLLFFIGADTVNIDTIMSAYGHVSNVNAITYIISLVLYIVIGIYFKFGNGGDKFGVK